MTSDETAKYATKSMGGGGKSSVVKGGSGGKGMKHSFYPGDTSAGSKRYDLTNRSLNRGGRSMR